MGKGIMDSTNKLLPAIARWPKPVKEPKRPRNRKRRKPKTKK